MVSIGVLNKGRSPSWPLLRLARQATAVQLICEIRPYLRYVESKRNHADGPSRGFNVGVAPAWVQEMDRERLKQEIHQRAQALRLGDLRSRSRPSFWWCTLQVQCQTLGGSRLPPTKQGAMAWVNPQTRHNEGLAHGGANLLICHSIQDTTALSSYMPGVREFLRWAIVNRRRQARTTDDLGELLADFFAHACYVQGRSHDYGSVVFFGLLALFPEFCDRLPRAHRALTAWRRIHAPREGQAIP